MAYIIIDGMYGGWNFLFGTAYIIIDGVFGGWDFLFEMAYVIIDGTYGAEISFLGRLIYG